MNATDVMAAQPIAISDRAPTVHEVKSWPEFFEAIRTGHKRHEMRRAHERDYCVGDIMRLREYDPHRRLYTGRVQQARITYVTSSDYPCALSDGALADGYCVLSIRLLDEEGADGETVGLCWA